MTTGYICDRCGATFTGGGRWLQGGYHGSTAIMHRWDLCPDCMEGFTGWMDCDRESVREHSLESESVRERRYESQDVTGSAGRVTEGGEMSHDTREKLEAAAQTAAGYIYGRGFTNGLADAWNDDEVDTAANQIIQLLDRQASITKKECADFWQEIAEDRDRVQMKCAELCNQVDELKAKLDAEAQHAREAWRLWGEADVKLERITAERDRWKDAFEDSERLRLELIEELEKRDKGIRRLKQRRGELMEQVRKLQDVAARDRLNAQR